MKQGFLNVEGRRIEREVLKVKVTMNIAGKVNVDQGCRMLNEGRIV